MPFNLLLFPLVGGYFIITRAEQFKYINQRVDRQVLLFNSALVGIFLLLFSFAICSLATYYFHETTNYIKRNYFPIQDKYFGTAVVSFFIAIPITYLSNWIVKKADALSSAIDRIGNELELLLKFSCSESELIQITLKTDKVYIGWVELLPKPHGTYVRVIPAVSGYRDEKKILHITVNYTHVYSDYIRQGKIRDISELEMSLIIKIDEILTASRFDFEIFEKFELQNRVQAAVAQSG